MKKQRLSIEELQEMPKEAFPVTVECDDGMFTSNCKRVVILSPIVDATNKLAITNFYGNYAALAAVELVHYPSMKPGPKIERFFEYLGAIHWYSEDKRKSFNGFSVFDTCGGSATLIKTGRYFDWDLANKCIIGKVETLKEM